MSVPLATIFHGDVTLEQGSDVSQFGWGDLNINRNCLINGTLDVTNKSSASLVVLGGCSIWKTTNIYENLNVYGTTNLKTTNIDTTDGGLNVNGEYGISIDVNRSSHFITGSGSLSLKSSTGNVVMESGNAVQNAIQITASDPSGGIIIRSGNNIGKIELDSNAGGLIGNTSSGSIILTSNNGGSQYVVNSLGSNQNLGLSLNGMTDSQLLIESSGINTTRTALLIRTTHTSGNIEISNVGGLGTGSLSQLVGSGGFNMITNTGGNIAIRSQGAGSNYLVDTNGPNQNLVLGLNGTTDSSLTIRSQATGTSAIMIMTENTNGNINIIQPLLSRGKVNILTGSEGFVTETQDGGNILIKTNGAPSLYTNATTLDDQHLRINVSGGTESKVIIDNDSPNSEAITLQTTNANGGIYLSGNGGIELQSQSYVNGIKIATSQAGIPVNIGTNTSVTTIHGDLFVKGVTTTINSTAVTVDDNILIVNNSPINSSDGGIAIKRYQYANDIGGGDVVNTVPEVTGTISSVGNIVEIYLDSNASSEDDYYKGWWIKILSGTGANQVRKIKSYNGLEKKITIYSSIDQVGILNNPIPIEGLDLTTIVNVTSTYGLYPCHYVMNIWDESKDEFSFICSNSSPEENVSIGHYADVHMNDLTANSIFINQINNSQADITTTITLNNNSTDPVEITGLPNNYGIYTVYIKPLNDTTRAHGIFMIGRVNSILTPGSIVRIISVKGANNDQLDMQWSANENPKVMYRPYPNGISGSTQYKVKLVSL